MRENKVYIETECGNKINDIDRASDKVEHVRTRDEPDKELQCKPGVTNALDIEERIMCICPVLVQRPGSGVVRGLDGEVVDDGDPHVRVGLQTEGQDRGADEEDRDNTNSLHYEAGHEISLSCEIYQIRSDEIVI